MDKKGSHFYSYRLFFLLVSLSRYHLVLQLNDCYALLSSSVSRICSACFSRESGACVNG